MQRKFKFDAEELNLITLAKQFSGERKARKLFEAMRWPDGKPICPHCGFDEVYKLTSKETSKTKLRSGVYCCAACRKPFTATVGTVFESSHLPLSKILMGIFILCNAKKSVSAMQLGRMLKTTYRASWFLAHRIRHAMATDLTTAKKLSGVTEADETFAGRTRNTKDIKRSALGTVALVVERGGEARTRVIASVTAKNVGKFLHETVSKDATVNTDEHLAYKKPAKEYKRHDTVVHSRYQYAKRNPDGTVSHK
jgi:transposase-like protein